MNILEEIAERTKERISHEKQLIPQRELIKQIQMLPPTEHPGFLENLQKPGMSYICEVKKASPSKGVIAEEFPYLQIAREYEAAGARAISCLTEPFWFQGADSYLKEIAQNVHIPVLLICAILTDEQLRSYRELAEELSMDALVEAHDETEVERALKSGAKIIGVNNRDLKTFTVDCKNSIRLRNLAPEDVVFVSESGIRTAQDIHLLAENRVDAVLIGETLMRSENKKAMLETLNGGALV